MNKWRNELPISVLVKCFWKAALEEKLFPLKDSDSSVCVSEGRGGGGIQQSLIIRLFFSFASTSNTNDSACKDVRKTCQGDYGSRCCLRYNSSRDLFKMVVAKCSTCYSLLAALIMEYDSYKFWRINIVCINECYLCFVWGDLYRWNTSNH